MKAFLSFFILSFVILTSSVRLYAQSTSSASISATIITPITIEKVADKDLSFGNIATGNSSGVVILYTNGARRAEGGAILPSSTGTVSTAEFLVKGEGSYSFSITLPASPVTLVNSTNHNETMFVDTFTSTPEATGTLSAGQQTLKIGASLNMSANQCAGNYSSVVPFNITVNYN